MTEDERKASEHTPDDADGASSQVLDEQVDRVLKDIESKGSFMLHRQPDAEEFNPDDVHAEEVPEGFDFVDEELTGTEAVDELSEALEVSEVEEEEQPAVLTEEEQLQTIERHRRRLRTVLLVALVILVLIAAVIGLFVWRGSLAPDVQQADTEALTTRAAGTDDVTFQPVESDAIPQLTGVLGKTTAQAQESCGDALVLRGGVQKAADSRIKSLTGLVNGSLVGETGVQVADVAFGVNEDNHIVYVYCSFDLDALEVADATFEELVSSDVVARSLLEDMGVPSDALQNAALDVSKNPQAIVSEEGDARQQAVFGGSTGAKAPASWQVTETYDQSVGQSLGDNSVMRTLLVELY